MPKLTIDPTLYNPPSKSERVKRHAALRKEPPSEPAKPFPVMSTSSPAQKPVKKPPFVQRGYRPAVGGRKPWSLANENPETVRKAERIFEIVSAAYHQAPK